MEVINHDENKRYSYAGPVRVYDKIVEHNYKGDTMAFTPQKALSNLAWRFKQENGYTDLVKIELDKKYLSVLY